jgi:hypothetical protein
MFAVFPAPRPGVDIILTTEWLNGASDFSTENIHQ